MTVLHTSSDLDPFADDQVPLHLLRTRAFNQRWAEQPPDVIPLTAADPDFAVAPRIRERLARWCADEGIEHTRFDVLDEVASVLLP